MREQSVAPDLLHLNAALGAFARGGRAELAEAWLGRMEDFAVRPDHISYSGVINAHARLGGVEQAERWLERMAEAGLRADGITYSSVINACARASEVGKAEGWLSRMSELGISANEVSYSSVINACARKGEVDRAEGWLKFMLYEGMDSSEVAYCSVINACAQQGEARRAEQWLQRMLENRMGASAVGYNSAINAFAQSGEVDGAEHWLLEMLRRRVQPTEVSYNSLINACAQRGDAERAELWLERMVESGIQPEEVSYNSVINACAKRGEADKAERWLERMLELGVPASAVTYNTVRTACARMGDADRAERWLRKMSSAAPWDAGEQGVWAKAWGAAAAADDLGRSGGPLKKALYRFCSQGDYAVVERLERALELQWVYGYPRVPPGEEQLTHGFFKYMAGMQPMTAREVLRMVPDAGRILDVFCGSGTVLIESLAAGRQAVGNDASPMAVFVASHHCDVHSVDLEEALRLAELASAPLRGGRDDWQELRRRIGELATTAPLREVLWFVFVVALRVAASTPQKAGRDRGPRRSADPEGGLARPYFLSNAYRYVAQVRALRRAAPDALPVVIRRGDVRDLRLDEPADAIITSPPYPGVYNYLAAASEDRRMMGDIGDMTAVGAPDFLREAAAAAFDPRQEVGAQELRTRQSVDDFLASWQAQQEEWLRAAHANLRPGGTATVMIGDGDAEEECAVDCLASTLAAAEAAGFGLVACASVESCADAAHRTKGMTRREHMVHLQRR